MAEENRVREEERRRREEGERKLREAAAVRERGAAGSYTSARGAGGGAEGGSRSGGAEVCGREAETVARAGISFSMSAPGPAGRGGRRYRSHTASLSARFSYVLK